MSILDRAKAHYSGIGKRHVDVPEWGEAGKPLRIFFTPLTVGERNKIYERDQNGVEPPLGTICVRALLEKATDEKGARLFDPFDDHETLMHAVDSNVVGRAASAMLGGLPKDADARAEQADKRKNA